MIVNVPLNAIGEDLASLPGPNIPSLVYCVREGAEIKFCAFCTRQIVVSPTSPPLLSASLSRALTTVLLCLLPSCRCLPAIKRGRDNAGVEEISPRFHPRHRFEGSSCLVISMDFFLFFLFSSHNEFASRIFFHDAWIKISRNRRTREYLHFPISHSWQTQGYRRMVN